LALVIYQNGIMCYILLADKIKIGDKIYSGSYILANKVNDYMLLGSSLPLHQVPLFTHISNIEYLPFGGGKLIRAAGTSGILAMHINLTKFVVKFKSG